MFLYPQPQMQFNSTTCFLVQLRPRRVSSYCTSDTRCPAIHLRMAPCPLAIRNELPGIQSGSCQVRCRLTDQFRVILHFYFYRSYDSPKFALLLSFFKVLECSAGIFVGRTTFDWQTKVKRVSEATWTS
jgi:hypothetical protein